MDLETCLDCLEDFLVLGAGYRDEVALDKAKEAYTRAYRNNYTLTPEWYMWLYTDGVMRPLQRGNLRVKIVRG
jgi:hypothetical protein